MSPVIDVCEIYRPKDSCRLVFCHGEIINWMLIKDSIFFVSN